MHYDKIDSKVARAAAHQILKQR